MFLYPTKDPRAFDVMLKDYFEEEAAKLGIDTRLPNCIIQIESGWNHRAQNKTSSAYGIGQFLDRTWERTGERMERELDRKYVYDQIDAFLWLFNKDGYTHWIVWPSCVYV